MATSFESSGSVTVRVSSKLTAPCCPMAGNRERSVGDPPVRQSFGESRSDPSAEVETNTSVSLNTACEGAGATTVAASISRAAASTPAPRPAPMAGVVIGAM